MNYIEYDKETSLAHFMDQYTIQRMERIIKFEESCTPKNEELIIASKIIADHLRGIWGIEERRRPAAK